ncbi:hypothetical protein JZ751_008937 [Albula glossodonta]|uniref:Ig-like domain-containing protein n=1 Tax=Albula glossodonta TaxID=121402 RepID=A0A8T2P845_9TELE|nr:hypothetical protein JZ751_008937 [Albula glossodonta]
MCFANLCSNAKSASSHGKQPVISIEGYSIGGVGLVCEATGWYPQPELIWRSSEGHSLPAEPAETLRDSLDLFTVRRRIIAQRDTSRVMCRVQLLQFSQEKDIEIHIRGTGEALWLLDQRPSQALPVRNCVHMKRCFLEERAIRVIMIGESWGGKSLSANRILGCSSFSSQCEECQTEKAVVDGRLMTVVITPAWEENKPLEETKKEKIRESFRHCLPGPHAILLVASARTALGDKSDWSTEQANVELLGGSRVWAHALVLLTCTDERSKRRLQDKGKTLGIVQRNCGGRYYVFNFKSDSRDQISNLLREITQIVEKQGGGFFLVHEEKRGSMVSISLEE